MQYIFIIGVLLICAIILFIISDINIKKLKALADDKELNELVKRFPSNIQICQYILNKLGNKHTKIKESPNSNSSLYIIANDTISIANINNTYSRVQTISHECLHSVQSKKLLWFNFIFSNIFILMYLIVIILTIFHIITNEMLVISALLVMTIILFYTRSYLEIDAMTKAKYLAKEYMEENKLTSKRNIEMILQKYDEINKIGIPFTCFYLILNQIIKIIIYCLICLI